MEGCSYNQIALILGVSTASVKLYLRNGKQRLKGRWRALQKVAVA
jgi:DNA-directed RNA polymerase specialized sigma24 family protein